MHICFLTNKYPNFVEPNAIVFYQQLINAIAKQGVKCSVICPVPINLNKNYKKLPQKLVEEYGDFKVEVYYPRCFGLGQRDYLCFNPAKITTCYFTKACDKIISKMDECPDVFYGHFVTPAGIAAARMGRKYNKPSFLAYGEAGTVMIKHFGFKASKKELSTLSGVIAVSSQNKIDIEPYVPNNITEVFPNSIDSDVFYPRDKQKAREKLGLSENSFVIAFVGTFDERKGIDRLSQAIDKLGYEDIVLICAGKGAIQPQTPRCAFKSPVLHSDLPDFLSAADIFVLPTLLEGCCNAIVEAIACGLPIISSNGSFNDDILDETNSLRVDPSDVDAISTAIKTLHDDRDLLSSLAEGSLTKAASLTLERRANNIIDFIERSK